jgi:hypothetical protein
MRAAVSLTPNHRFVLRSASRFFLHVHEIDFAHSLLRRSSATPHDSWLLAAEIAIATVAGRTSTLIKPARALITTGNLSPFQLTELASALGTLEARDGRRKAARKLFGLALEDPTENTVAQAQWTARHTGLIDFEERFLTVRGTYEARAWGSYASHDWAATVTAAEHWLEDESFASRPAELGTAVAAVGLEDGMKAVRFAKLAALANPTSQRVRSNEAFALALAGRLGEAAEALFSVVPSALTPEERVVWLANGGLLGYRMGDKRIGDQGYEAAVKAAQELKNKTLEAAALTYWAAEAFRWVSAANVQSTALSSRDQEGEPQHSPPILAKRAREALENVKVQHSDLAMARLNLERAEGRAAERKIDAAV